MTSNTFSSVPTLLSIAVQAQEAGRAAEAIATLENLLEATPEHIEALTRLGWLQAQLGQHERACASHERALAIDDQFASAWSNLGVARQAKGDLQGAIAAFERAIALEPSLPHSTINLGLALQACGQITRAIACYRSAVRSHPDVVEGWINLSIALQEQGQIGLALAANAQALVRSPHHAAANSNSLMTLQYSPNATLAELKASAVRVAAGYATAAPSAPPLQRRRKGKDEPLRIGYVSGDFYMHPIGWLASQALCRHDPERFEVHCFADGIRRDVLSDEIRNGVAHWHETAALNHATLAERVRSLEIDVLIDLAGHTAGNRMPVFMRRAAPVQLSWLGYAATTGSAAIDGTILCEAMAPGAAQEAFVEPIVRLHRIGLSYRPPDDAPAIAPCPAQRNGFITFGSFNNPAKISGDVLATWAQVLQAVPNSRLVLKWRSFVDPARAHSIRTHFALLGIEASRIDLRGASPHAQLLAEYGDIDIALDPFPFCGGLTSCEALWMGVPVVTLPWMRPLSRQGAAILQAIGIEGCIATSPREYVRRAAQLAQRSAERENLRTSLRARMQASHLLDGIGLSRELERVFRQMYDKTLVSTKNT